MRRAGHWLVLAVGSVLCVGGAVVAWQAGAPDPGWPTGSPPASSGAYVSELQLTFDQHRSSVVWSATRLVGAAAALLGAALVAGLAGRLLGRRTTDAAARVVTPRVRRVLLVGAVGCLLVVAGIVLAATTGWPVHEVVSYTGGYEPLVCPDDPVCAPPARGVELDGWQLTGLSFTASGTLLVAVVSGWLLGRDSRLDQQ